MKRAIILGFALFALLLASSCSSARRISVDEQRRGLLLLEGEQIYKNKGFYKAQKSKKHRKKTLKASRKRYKR